MQDREPSQPKAYLRQRTQTIAAIHRRASSSVPVKACVLFASTETRQSLDGSYLPIAASG
jgi:hypothetical protein